MEKQGQSKQIEKRPYVRPQLVKHGSVEVLTHEVPISTSQIPD
ncbi:MAG TPA: hypothetical protein VHD56_15120 [Tepidisphaeraceae bacterium]|nr:hypothetical protein [Tepidisphaeraceae bacterium]